MGLYDTITVDPEFSITCPKCSAALNDFQTKDLESTMDSYCLRLDNGKARLFCLGEPDKKYWREYTDEEIAQANADIGDSVLRGFLERKKGDGYFVSEAFLPENRRFMSMGDFPHQWVLMYTKCEECAQWVDVKLKFTDGIAEKWQIETDNYTSSGKP